MIVRFHCLRSSHFRYKLAEPANDPACYHADRLARGMAFCPRRCRAPVFPCGRGNLYCRLARPQTTEANERPRGLRRVAHLLNSEVVLDISGASLFAVSAKGVLVLRFPCSKSRPIPPFAKTAKNGAPVKSETQLRDGVASAGSALVVKRALQGKRRKGTRSRW
jgi:hypothetical protein